MAGSDRHPADTMIIGKATSKSVNATVEDPSKADRKGVKRKRSLEGFALNISHADSDDEESDKKILKQKSNLLDSSALTRKKTSLIAPIGVTIIGDDEDEVQVGMQKAMRMPRYFTKRSFDGSSKRCFSCGQQGHFNRDCPNARAQRPCYLCAKFGHSDLRCPASKTRCYKCNRLGHLSRECPYPQNCLAIPMLCTRCGDPDCKASGQPDWVRAEGGCNRTYSDSDLEVIRCYTCGQKGHLTCKKTSAVAAFPYCFNCGSEGHLGMECPTSATYLASMEKREAPNQRGLEELRSTDHSDMQRASKRARRDPEFAPPSSYWQSSPPSGRAPAAPPGYVPNLNVDVDRYQYSKLPPIRHPPPRHVSGLPPQYQVQVQQLPGQQYGQAQYQQIPASSFAQGLPQGRFTMGYGGPQQAQQHPHQQERYFPRRDNRIR